MMELSEFAGKILLSGELSEKLAGVDFFSDDHPCLDVVLPGLPSRNKRLSLERFRSSARVTFPTRAELLEPSNIAVLLHFFANHELLALELMALALLKFPDAPAAFRMGIAHTMRDEQRHLLAYIQRMSELGLDFGDIPLNDFFWSQCSSMQTPMDYVCRMSLTFEQANLDFAAYFRDVLAEIGDQQTSDLMQQVLLDEMNHVKHGLNWFRRWKPENESDWQVFCRSLGAEINPSRAKGTSFRSDYRKAIGLSDDYINSLHVFSKSKGTPPRVVMFNPDAEEDVRTGAALPPVMSVELQQARDDLAPVMLYLSSQTDLVLVARPLPTDFLLQLRASGFLLPEFLTVDSSESGVTTALQGRVLSGVLPWSVSPASQRLEAKLGLTDASQFKGDQQGLRTIHSKSTALALLKEFLAENADDKRVVDVEFTGDVVCSQEEFDDCLLKFRNLGLDGRFVAKRPWSASGRHRVFGFIRDGAFAQQPVQVRNWFEKSWKLGEVPILQPYFDRVADLSVQCRIEVADNHHKVIVLGMTKVLNSDRGQYVGTCVGRFLSARDREFTRFFHQKSESKTIPGQGIDEFMTHLAKWTGDRLSRLGLSGAFGIDSFVFRGVDGQLKLYPMIEINPRHTMGRVALALARRMLPGRTGLWLHVSKAWLQKLNAASFSQLKQRWQAALPLQTQSSSGGVVILSGLLETTPAEDCAQVWTCFLVSQDLSKDLREMGLESVVNVSGFGLKVDKPGMQL
jgi:uncharacterized ferritin-like protein (DUF455 family)